MEWLLEGTALIVAASDAAGRTSEACRSPSRAGMASACLMASCNDMHPYVDQSQVCVLMWWLSYFSWRIGAQKSQLKHILRSPWLPFHKRVVQ